MLNVNMSPQQKGNCVRYKNRAHLKWVKCVATSRAAQQAAVRDNYEDIKISNCVSSHYRLGGARPGPAWSPWYAWAQWSLIVMTDTDTTTTPHLAAPITRVLLFRHLGHWSLKLSVCYVYKHPNFMWRDHVQMLVNFINAISNCKSTSRQVLHVEDTLYQILWISKSRYIELENATYHAAMQEHCCSPPLVPACNQHHQYELSGVWSSAANRLIGEVVQSRRRPLLGPSPGWKRLLALSHLRHY